MPNPYKTHPMKMIVGIWARARMMAPHMPSALNSAPAFVTPILSHNMPSGRFTISWVTMQTVTMKEPIWMLSPSGRA